MCPRGEVVYPHDIIVFQRSFLDAGEDRDGREDETDRDEGQRYQKNDSGHEQAAGRAPSPVPVQQGSGCIVQPEHGRGLVAAAGESED